MSDESQVVGTIEATRNSLKFSFHAYHEDDAISLIVKDTIAEISRIIYITRLNREYQQLNNPVADTKQLSAIMEPYAVGMVKFIGLPLED